MKMRDDNINNNDNNDNKYRKITIILRLWD